ncbi:MAG: integrase, partial [Treponema sp.]|nr:integrase [Treponema sp.]
MDVVYLFHRPDGIELPFFDSDPVLLRLLARSACGARDHSRYFVPTARMGAPDLRRLLSGRPCV